MEILQDQRKASFAEIALARLADGARRRVGPERLVIGAAVVVAGEPEEAWNPEDEQRRGEVQKAGVPRRPGTEQGVRGGTEELRRVKRRDIGSKCVGGALP